MKRSSLLLLVVLAAAVARPVLAEQQVTLKSGVAIIGEVKFDGDAVVVRIDDADQRVPLSEVASVSSTKAGQSEQSRRLLLAAVEIRALGGAPQEALGLIAEAARLAPDDPQIAFWYASALVDAGSGNAAKRVIDAHRADIEKQFPDRIDKLTKRINARVLVELLPEEMVARIDSLNAALALLPDEAQQRPYFVAFRVVDQFGEPVSRTAIQVNGNGNDFKVEDFPRGHFLATFNRQRDQRDEPVQVQVNEYGLKSSSHQLPLNSGQRFPATEISVHRFEEGDKQVFHGVVRDAAGDPVAGARVAMSPQVNSNPEQYSQTAAVGENGQFEFRGFPGSYNLSANAQGFINANDQAEVQPGINTPEVRLVLHRAIVAKIRVAWTAAPMQPGGAGQGNMNGETTLILNPPNGRGGNNQEVQWLQPRQEQKQIMLQMNLMMYGYGYQPMAGGGGPWVKKWTPENEGNEEQRTAAALKLFDTIDLKKADEAAKDFKTVNAGGGGGFGPANANAPADFGDIFVGHLVSRDMRTGQPIDMTFKIIVEHEKDDAENRAD